MFFLIALTTTYNINVVTSDLRGAGTDANVFIQLFGDKNDSGKFKIRKILKGGLNFLYEKFIKILQISSVFSLVF